MRNIRMSYKLYLMLANDGAANIGYGHGQIKWIMGEDKRSMHDSRTRARELANSKS